MIEQIFRVTLGSEVITDEVSSATITEQMQMVYQVCTFQSNINIATEQDVKVELGDKTFDGFIYSITKVSKSMFSVECRSVSARLTTPYHSDNDYQVEDSITSHDLCAEYALRYDIPINITSIDLDFGGNYERNGTPLSVLQSIANTTLAKIWWDGDTMQIHPKIPIEEMGRVIPPESIIDFIPSQKNIDQRGVKYIVVGESAQSQTTTNMRCTAKVDPCNGETIARVIPHGAYQSSNGLSLSAISTPIIHSSTIASSLSAVLEADIVSIKSVTVGGVNIQGYSFKYDTLIFPSEQRGLLKVDYIGYGYHGYANIRNVDNTRYSQFDIFYGDCEVFSYQNEMNCSDTDGVVECEGVTVFTPKTMNYAAGFNFQTSSDVKITFYSDDQVIPNTVVTESGEKDWVDKGVLSERMDGTAVCTLRFDPLSLTEVRTNGVDITSHCSLAGRELSFDKVYTGVTIAYTTTILDHHVKFSADSSLRISMIVNSCDFNLDGADLDGSDGTVCADGMSIGINMVEELGVKIWSATWRLVPVTYPDGSGETLTTDGFGVLHIQSVPFGETKIDVSRIDATAKMILRAAGGEL